MTSPDVVLTSSALLTHADAEVQTDFAVHVSGDRIVAITDRTDPSIAGIEIVDLGNVTIMPGLIDCHVHLAFDPGSGTTTTAVDNDAEAIRERMRGNATKLLDAGVTTARDLGAPGYLAADIRTEIDAAVIHGPSLQVAHAPITVPGGHAHAMGGEVKNEDEARALVRTHAAHGADVIKVMATGGFMTAGTHPWEARFEPELLRAIIDEAHGLGLLTTTHALGNGGIAAAVEAGFDALEHCGWVTKGGTEFVPAIAQQIKERGVYVDPTMNTACKSESYFCPWDTHDAVVGNVRKMHELGLRIVAGTDAGIGFVHFERYHDGLQVLSEAGMDNRAVIGAATARAAEACGLGETTGKLAPGMRADIIAVVGDPTLDLDALARIRFVMAAGREYVPRPIPPFAADPAQLRQVQEVLAAGAGR